MNERRKRRKKTICPQLGSTTHTQLNPNIKNDDSHEKQSILISSVR